MSYIENKILGFSWCYCRNDSYRTNRVATRSQLTVQWGRILFFVGLIAFQEVI